MVFYFVACLPVWIPVPDSSNSQTTKDEYCMIWCLNDPQCVMLDVATATKDNCTIYTVDHMPKTGVLQPGIQRYQLLDRCHTGEISIQFRHRVQTTDR